MALSRVQEHLKLRDTHSIDCKIKKYSSKKAILHAANSAKNIKGEIEIEYFLKL